jgi:hypothetical protein
MTLYDHGTRMRNERSCVAYMTFDAFDDHLLSFRGLHSCMSHSGVTLCMYTKHMSRLQCLQVDTASMPHLILRDYIAELTVAAVRKAESN